MGKILFAACVSQGLGPSRTLIGTYVLLYQIL